MNYIGTDIVEVSRIKSMIDRYGRRFLNKIFTDKEITYCEQKHVSSIHYAGKFSAKESVIKAVSHLSLSQSFSYRDVEITNNINPNYPIVEIKKKNLKLAKPFDINLSISHTDDYATSVAILTLC